MTAAHARLKANLYYQLWDFCRDRNPERARFYLLERQKWLKAHQRLIA